MAIVDPQVSVVIPTRNRARTLERSVRSVLDQEGVALEVIVVDDGSTDDTPTVLSRLADSRLRVVHRSLGHGAAAARNAGAAVARGELLAFQDSDDAWRPGKLAQQLPAFRDPRVGMAYSRALLHGRRKAPFPPIARLPSGALHALLLRGNLFCTPTVVVRRRLFEDAGGFDPAFPQLEDWDLWVRLSRSCRVAGVDNLLVDVYPQDDSLSRDRGATIDQGLERFVAVHLPGWRAFDRTRARWKSDLGFRLIRQGRVAAGRRQLRQAFLSWPFGVQSFVRGYLDIPVPAEGLPKKA